jgi:hypothetical protein
LNDWYTKDVIYYFYKVENHKPESGKIIKGKLQAFRLCCGKTKIRLKQSQKHEQEQKIIGTKRQTWFLQHSTL